MIQTLKSGKMSLRFPAEKKDLYECDPYILLFADLQLQE